MVDRTSSAWQRLRRAVQANAHRAPWLYNLRNDLLAFPQLLRRKVHDPDLWALDRVEARSGAVPLVFDVGANVGQSIVSIKQILPDARVVAFEPNPATVRWCERVARRVGGVEVRQAACAATGEQRRTIYVPRARGVVLSQLASMDPIDPTGILDHMEEAGFGWVRPGEVEVDEIPVRTVALAELGLRPDAIKVDVEGAELEVLEGARPLLESDDGPQVVIVERGDRGPVGELMRSLPYRQLPSSTINAVYERVAAA